MPNDIPSGQHFTIGIEPKRWRCSRGHQWEDAAACYAISFNFPDMTDGVEGYCGRCMLERAREFLGRVREDV